ncbi:hypothetical protein [Marinobacter sp.]|uniref:hypothetical protein n=1 Tax=Marinobacter sp. TaxID=50741 RepID=UPI00384C4AF1
MNTDTFDTDTALEAARALDRILASRMHRRKVMGQEVLVPGQLGQALRLPLLLRRLQSRQLRQREKGLEDFNALWETLSGPTRRRVLDALGRYDPQALSWEDKRSNRRPRGSIDDP